MRDTLRTAITLIIVLATLFPSLVQGAQRSTPTKVLPPETYRELREKLDKSYLELFEMAPTLKYTAAELEAMRKQLDESEKQCVRNFKQRADQYGRQITQTQAELKRRSASLGEDERRDLHCRIQNNRILQGQDQVLANHAIPVAYENKKAKVDLIQKWPEQLKQIQQELASGAYQNRRFADVLDIGFRDIASKQEDDVKVGQEAIDQMRRTGLMPPEIKNEAVRRYVVSLAEKIAPRSDLRVPVKVMVLNSKEVNAFALPGGFIFLERGLLEEAEDEAQLAGVIAHEIAHAAGRHGNRLMKRSTIAGIIYQAAQIAAVVLTGGVAGIGTYYALQYGFYGLGLVLSLDLLGKSRELELEADQLGVQYAWASGYDPSGFIRFFDKMATKVGYVNSASWFRTHPAFFERMVQTQREIMFLPKKDNYIVQTPEFLEMKKELKNVTAEAEKEDKDRPSMLAPEKGCPAPQKIEYVPGQPIEDICAEVAK